MTFPPNGVDVHSVDPDTLVGVSSARVIPGGNADDSRHLMVPTSTSLLMSALLRSFASRTVQKRLRSIAWHYEWLICTYTQLNVEAYKPDLHDVPGTYTRTAIKVI